MVMRRGVIIASQIDLSEAMITQQVTDAQLLSGFVKAREITKLDTNTSGRYKNLPFCFIYQGFQRVRML